MGFRHPLSPYARQALQVVGAHLAAARRARRMPLAELAERVGVSQPTMRKVERGDPSVAIGTVFETAFILGVDLLGADARSMPDVLARERDRLALLPARVRERKEPVDDDF